MSLSPFAPRHVDEPPAVSGVALATAAAGIKAPGRTDVLLMTFVEGTALAGVFTTSRCPSAPVEWCRERLGNGTAKALLVNAGNANAFTGLRGREAARRSAELAASAVGCEADAVMLASTGVIGEPLATEPFANVMDRLAARLAPHGWADAARAIGTTDTFAKVAHRCVTLDGEAATLVGIAKGAGMIAPDMATMLSFIATDAAIPAKTLQAMLTEAVARTFNRITVDSDTSTSDTVLAFATGAGDAAVSDRESPGGRAFAEALEALCRDLAQAVVKDGEGCSKFAEITVSGAQSDSSAHRIARAIADSPLVKTALAGEDANWGRVVMAVGKAGEPADRDRLAIWFGDVRVAVNGERDPDYTEEAAAAVMTEAEITIRVDLGIGAGTDTVWTCDLTRDYVAINGDYRS